LRRLFVCKLANPPQADEQRFHLSLSLAAKGWGRAKTTPGHPHGGMSSTVRAALLRILFQPQPQSPLQKINWFPWVTIRMD
jgi:hypothetical protein